MTCTDICVSYVLEKGKYVTLLIFKAIVGWCREFLNNRVQHVVFHNKASYVAPVTSGVPLGSVLSPILFLVFIKNMPECIKSKCRLFTDDNIVYRTITFVADSATLQKDLDSLQNWELAWDMSFNSSKCNTIDITRKTKVI